MRVAKYSAYMKRLSRFKAQYHRRTKKKKKKSTRFFFLKRDHFIYAYFVMIYANARTAISLRSQ